MPTRRNVKALFVLLAALLAAAPAAPAQESEERLSSLLGGRVTFTLPATWEVRRHVNAQTRGHAQLSIPYPAAEKSPHSGSVVLLAANTVPEGVTLRQLSDGVYKNNYEGLRVLSDEFDGEEWRTMVWRFLSNGNSYVVLHRFGLVGRTSVELQAALPLLAEGDPKWIEKTVADFNALSASLRIDGRNRTGAVVKLDQIPQPQKVNPKP